MPNDRSPFPPASRGPAVAPELDVGSYLPNRANVAAPKPAPAGAGSPSVLAAALDRLDRVIDEESKALAANAPVDLEDITRRKSQSLLELTRLSRGLAPGPDGGLTARLASERDRLAANHRMLGLHLAAVREISGLMLGILSEAESDGTYDPAQARRAVRP